MEVLKLKKCACRAFRCVLRKLAPDILSVINLSVLLSFFSKCPVTHSIKSSDKTSSTGMSDILEVNPTLEGFFSSWTCYKFMVLSLPVKGAGAQCFFSCGS